MSVVRTVAVVGSDGYVGSNIAIAVEELGYNLIRIRRKDPAEELCRKADVIIYSANPAKRQRAEKDPATDFIETVEKTAKFFKLTKGKRFVLVSSLSCRTQPFSVYGRHRRACELICLTGTNTSAIRLGPMFGGFRKQDMLHDIICNRHVYISAETKYAYVDVAWAGKKIVELINTEKDLIEIGAKNYLRMGDIAKKIGSTSTFEGRTEDQIPESFSEGPDANDLYEYVKKEIETIDRWKELSEWK